MYRNTMMLDAICDESRKPERLRRMTEQDLSLQVCMYQLLLFTIVYTAVAK